MCVCLCGMCVCVCVCVCAILTCTVHACTCKLIEIFIIIAIRGNIPPYCPTRGIAIIDLLYDFRVTIGTGNNERAIRGNVAL